MAEEWRCELCGQTDPNDTLDRVRALVEKFRKIAGVGKGDYAETLRWCAAELERALEGGE